MKNTCAQKCEKDKSPAWQLQFFLFLVIGLFHYTTINSQPGNIIADRPGFSTGTHSVTPGKFYLELGYLYSFTDGNDLVNHSEIPDLNIRIGVADKLEVSAMWAGWSISHKKEDAGINWGNDAETGMPGLGVKYQLARSGRYNLTLLGLLEGTDAKNSFSVDPAIALAWDFELNGRFELFGLVQGGSEVSAAGGNFRSLFALGLGFNISERLESFAEYYNIAYPGDSELFSGSEFGIMYLLTPEIQLDVYGGYGFDREIDHYLGLGISRRF